MAGYLSDDDFPVKMDFSIESPFADLEIEFFAMRLRAEKSPFADIGIGGSVATSPVVHEGVVYFGACDKRFYALDAETGRKIWSFSTAGPVNCSPALDNGVLFFGSFDQNLYALTLDGKLLWKFPTNGKLISTPVVHKSVVYFGSFDGNLYAVDCRTGKELWRFGTNGCVMSWPIVENDTIYFGSNDYNFYALALDGKLKWRFGTGREIVANAVFSNGVVYFGSFDSFFYALDAETGNLLWKKQFSEPPNSIIVRKGGNLYFGSRNSKLYSVTTDGKVVWSFQASQSTGGGVSFMGDTVYFGSLDKNLYALDIHTGTLAWKFHTNGWIVHSVPAFFGNRVYFGSWDCNLYCVTTEGSLVWKFRTSLGYTAPIYLESEKQTLETVWKPELRGEEKTPGKTKEKGFTDYGVIGKGYLGDGITNYMGTEPGEGPQKAYKSGKRVYRA